MPHRYVGPDDRTGHAYGDAHASPLDHVAFGIYDPNGGFARDDQPAIEHIFVFWQALDLRDFRRRLDQARARGRIMMVTVEPFTRAPNWRDGGDRLFQESCAASSARRFPQSCGAIGDFDGRVLVRWATRWKIPRAVTRGPAGDARGYQAAFRHFVDQCRSFAPEARYVWSPNRRT